ncbi:MAG TPA: hypothetical protein VFB62_17715 [Polyangiaceae bacterium]|nr:hypothetical protein [Polyangiaceae bacterium]
MSEHEAHPRDYAAPPDDGGDRGVFSTPDDLLIICPPDPGPHPELNIDPARQRPPRAGAGQTLLVLLMLVLAIPILWAYCVR